MANNEMANATSILSNQKANYVLLDDKLILPPMFSYLLVNTCEYQTKLTKTVLFQPIYVADGLMIDRSVNMYDNYIRCRLINAASDYLVIPKHTPLRIIENLPP